MKTDSIKWKLRKCLAILIMLVSAGCSVTVTAEATPTIIPASTPEKLSLINGEMNACQLISPTEAETVLGIKVVSELRFATVGSIVCKYVSVSDDRVAFVTDITTDATLKKANDSSSAAETYEIHKMDPLIQSGLIKVKDLENFGDQAYLTEGVFLDIHVLKNNIYYNFNTRTDGGTGYDALLKLAQIALQRMP